MSINLEQVRDAKPGMRLKVRLSKKATKEFLLFYRLFVLPGFLEVPQEVQSDMETVVAGFGVIDNILKPEFLAIILPGFCNELNVKTFISRVGPGLEFLQVLPAPKLLLKTNPLQIVLSNPDAETRKEIPNAMATALKKNVNEWKQLRKNQGRRGPNLPAEDDRRPSTRAGRRGR